jgi:hypothetical protein
VECEIQKDPKNIRNEVDAQNKDNRKKEYPFSSKLKIVAFKTETSLYSQHVICIPRQIEFILSDGFTGGW